MADDQHTCRELPAEVANCPNCTRAIHFVETLEDTFDRQVKRWFCAWCATGGDLTLTMNVRRGSDPRPDSKRVIAHLSSRARAGAT